MRSVAVPFLIFSYQKSGVGDDANMGFKNDLHYRQLDIEELTDTQLTTLYDEANKERLKRLKRLKGLMKK